ncbi:MAG: sigma-70 family RNA polymerase sigma factor [Planctomycetaceae bacterium]|nr:sigma-70 family RNA polymerase sigma factor [Planctomycetaceae bacterium]
MDNPEKTRSQQLTLHWTQALPVVSVYINSAVPRAQDSEDILQSVALTIADKFDQFDPEKSFVAWAIGIARIKVLLYYRTNARNKKVRILDAEVLSQIEAICKEESPHFGEVRNALEYCMRNLKGRWKQVLEMRYLREYSVGRISQYFGISQNAVFVILHRVRLMTAGNWSAGLPTTAAADGRINISYVAAHPTVLIEPGTNIVCGNTGYLTDLHGPNHGATLNINGGTLTHNGFVMSPVSRGTRSYLNLSNGAVLAVRNLGLGDNWWWSGPYVTMNIDGNSTVTVADYLWLGGYLNLYSGTVDITNGFNIAVFPDEGGTPQYRTGELTTLDIHAGTFIVRNQDHSANVPNWIESGLLLAYGDKPNERGSSQIIVDTTTIPGGTILTALPSLAARDPNVQPANPNGTVGTLISDTQVEITLNWNAGIDPNLTRGLPFNPDILTHYVWVGAEGQPMTMAAAVPQVSETNPANSHSIVLNQATLYYWSVEEGIDNGSGFAYPSGDPNNIAGPIWSFRTKAMTPEILTDPDNAVANPNAVFTVTGSDVVTAYQWYKEAGASDIALTDNAKYSGTQTASLTVINAALADEGQYYCVAKNGTVTSEPSAAATLWTQRLMGHWKFDGNLLDSVAATVPGAAAHDGAIGANSVAGDGAISYGTGINSGSAVFANDGDYVAIADPNFFNFYPLGFTVSFWYKETGAAGWRLPMSKLDGGVGGWLFGTDDAFRNQVFFTNPQDTPEFWADGNADIDLTDGQWHMITGIYNPATTTYTIFTDGDENESIVLDWSVIPTAAAPLSIGGRNTESSILGEIDDVQIYSRVLTPLEIAQKYLAFEPGKWVCVEDPANPLTLDVTGDCRVSLEDLAVLASQWLQCRRIPAASCTW